MSGLNVIIRRRTACALFGVSALAILASVGWMRLSSVRLDAALLEAITANRPQDVTVLLNRGADPNARGSYPTCGTEPSIWTWSYCRQQFDHLLGHGLREDEKAALGLAAESGSIATV